MKAENVSPDDDSSEYFTAKLKAFVALEAIKGRSPEELCEIYGPLPEEIAAWKQRLEWGAQNLFIGFGADEYESESEIAMRCAKEMIGELALGNDRLMKKLLGLGFNEEWLLLSGNKL